MKRFTIHSSDKQHFLLPIQAVMLTLLALTALSFWEWSRSGNTALPTFAMLLHVIAAPFYLGGAYLYRRIARHEQEAALELDEQSGLILYANSRKDLKILFHHSQVESCEWHQNLLLPFGVDYLFLRIRGGYEVCVSSLLVSPAEVMAHIQAPCKVRQQFVNWRGPIYET